MKYEQEHGQRWLIRVVQIIVCLLATRVAHGQSGPLHPGDIVIGTSPSGGVFKIDPISGDHTLLSSGNLVSAMSGVAIDNQGQIFTHSLAGIVQVNPATGDQTLIYSGQPFDSVLPLALGSNNDAIFGSNTGNSRQIIDISLQNGVRNVITTLSETTFIGEVNEDRQGRFVVVDAGATNVGGGKIERFDPSTSQETDVSTGGYLNNPLDLVIDSDGNYLVSDHGADGLAELLKIDANTGAQQLISQPLFVPLIALEDENHAILADLNNEHPMLRADLRTGETSVLENYAFFPGDITGVAIFSPVPESSSAELILIGGIWLLTMQLNRMAWLVHFPKN